MTHKLTDSGEQDRQLPLEVLRQFRMIFGSVKQHFREVEKQCGISGSLLWVLKEIHQKPDIGVSELANRLSIHQSTCSQLVEKLEAKGFIKKQRKRSDQRRVGLDILPEGIRALIDAPGPLEGILPEALAMLPEETLRNLQMNLSAVIDHLHSRDERFAGKPLADI